MLYKGETYSLLCPMVYTPGSQLLLFSSRSYLESDILPCSVHTFTVFPGTVPPSPLSQVYLIMVPKGQKRYSGVNSSIHNETNSITTTKTHSKIRKSSINVSFRSTLSASDRSFMHSAKSSGVLGLFSCGVFYQKQSLKQKTHGIPYIFFVSVVVSFSAFHLLCSGNLQNVL